MKKFLLLIFVLLLPFFTSAQYKIRVSKINLFSHGNDYLIDVPLKNPVSSLLLIDNDTLMHRFLSLKQRPDFNDFVDTMIIVTNKRAHYIAKRNVYIFTGFHNDFEADTFYNANSHNFRNFKSLLKPTRIPEDSILVYYSESFGGFPQHIGDQASLNKLVKDFEEKHNVKLKKYYTQSFGDEGEHAVYFTLQNLTGIQKLEFISSRRKQLISENEFLEYDMTSHFYTPFWIFNPDILRMPVKDRPKSVIYQYVDEDPTFPGGTQAFNAFLHKKISYKNNDYRAMVSFVVKHDGSIANIKLIRSGGYSNLDDKLIKALKKCPAWNPGKLNGVAISSTYVLRVGL